MPTADALGAPRDAFRTTQMLGFEDRMRRKFKIGLFVAFLAASAAAIGSRIAISAASDGKTYSSATDIPHRRVGLVLGCSKSLQDGRLNQYFANRIAAAAKLYLAGGVEYLIVSGDNHVQGYDEPTDMKTSLVALGVPASRIYCDYAGFRTLDSVVRAKKVFGQSQITVISQEFHNRRAIYIAKNNGIDAVGLNALEVSASVGFKTRCREELARVKTVLDVWIFRTVPRFLGEPIDIGKSEAQHPLSPSKSTDKTTVAEKE